MFPLVEPSEEERALADRPPFIGLGGEDEGTGVDLIERSLLAATFFLIVASTWAATTVSDISLSGDRDIGVAGNDG